MQRFLPIFGFFLACSNPVFGQLFKAERQLVDSLNNNGKYAEALEVAEKTQHLACGNSLDSTCATWLHMRGNCHRSLKKSHEAEADYRAALEIRGRYPNRRSEFANSLHGLGTALYEQDRLIEARDFLLRSVALRDSLKLKPNKTLGASLNNLGNVAAELGNFTEAERYFERALTLFDSIAGPESRESATVFSNLISTATELGNLERAAYLQKKAVDLRFRVFGREHPLYASSLSNWAYLYAKIENWPRAKAILEEAISIYFGLKGFGPDCSPALENRATLARALSKNGENEVAETTILAVLDKVKNTADSAKFGWANTIYGEILMEKGQLEAAKTAFRTAIRLQRSILSERDPSILQTLEHLAAASILTHDWAAADSLFAQTQAQDFAEIETFFPKMSDRERQFFFRPIQGRFERFCELVWLAENERPELVGRLFDLRLATRGALFSASQKMREQFRASGDLEDYEKWLQTRERLAALQLRTSTETEAWGVSIPELFEESRRLEKKLRLASPNFWDQTRAQQPDWRLVQLALKTDEAAVEIIRFQTKKSSGADSVFYLALVLTSETSDAPTVVHFGDGAELETVFFELFRDETRRERPRKSRPSPSFFAFWQPLEAVIGPKKRIFIAPDGVFHKINLAAIRRPDGSYLFDSLDIRTVTSLGDLVKIGQKNEASASLSLPKTALLVGGPSFDFSEKTGKSEAPFFTQNLTEKTAKKTATDASVFGDLRGESLAPLEHAEQEIRTIERLFLAESWQVSTFLGSEATEDVVKKAVSPTVVHIATHGLFLKNWTAESKAADTSFVSKNALLRSMLFFAGAQNALDGQKNEANQDGILTAMEAQNLRLDGTELVVLSACKTADGEMLNGEGVFGLQRAFRVAGAKSLLMSLWNVDDEATRFLMETFYEKWLGGGCSKNEAFRFAQLETRRNYPLPMYWASFILLGK